MEEIGTSDVSIMVREVYNEVGVEYPEEVNEDKEECKYCGGDCPNDEEHACDGYLGDIDDLYKVTEAKDKVTYDPKTGKLTGWEHEGDWKKQTKKKDPVGKIHVNFFHTSFVHFWIFYAHFVIYFTDHDTNIT